jgi:predicted nucleic acid-binding protein
MTVSDAIKTIVTSYGDIDLVARGMVVDAAELAKATAKTDTAEAIALALLRKYNVTAPVVVIQEVVQEAEQDTTE